MEISVLLVDDQRLALAGLASLLDGLDGLRVTGTAADLAVADQALEAGRPDVVLADLSMPGCAGAEVVGRLLGRHPGLILIALAEQADDALQADALQAGAAAVLVKDVEPEDLVRAIRAVAVRVAA
jgi:DNA-binding NarL/FixJ family response regulator